MPAAAGTMSSVQSSELCPLSTRLVPRELAHAFGIAVDTHDSSNLAPGAAAAAVAAAAGGTTDIPGIVTTSAAAAAQEGDTAGPGEAQPTAGGAPTASVQPTWQQLDDAAGQQQQQQQQQATSSLGAAQYSQQQQAPSFRGFPAAAAYVAAAVPSLSAGSLGVPPLAVYTHADLTAMMALQQQHQRAQQEEDEQTARALKRPRLVWTPELHKLFEAAVAKIGVNKAVPKTIMQEMNVEGLTRENVASHLQKYRLSLRKGPDGEFITTVTEGTDTAAAPDASPGGGGSGGADGAAAARTADAAAGGRGSSSGAAAAAGSASGDTGGNAAAEGMEAASGQ